MPDDDAWAAPDGTGATPPSSGPPPPFAAPVRPQPPAPARSRGAEVRQYVILALVAVIVIAFCVGASFVLATAGRGTGR